MRSIVSNLGRIAIAAASAMCLTAQAAPFDNLYVFGDSLLDSGNSHLLTGGAYPASPPYAGVFTNGPVASQVLANQLGLPLVPSVLGGNNYATSGATTGEQNVAALVYGPFAPPIANLVNSGLQQQIDAFVGENVPMEELASSLFVIWSGSNDVFLLSALALSGGIPADPAMAALLQQQFFLAGLQAAANVESAILELVGAGAQTVLAGNLPDLTRIPFVSDLEAPFVAQFVTAFSSTFLDPSFFAALSGIDPLANVVTFDAKGLFDAALAGGFGFTNTEDACLPTFGPFPVGAPCANPDAYLFWDDIHPTAKAHKLLGNVMFAAVVPEPQTLLLLVALGFGGAVTLRRRR